MIVERIDKTGSYSSTPHIIEDLIKGAHRRIGPIFADLRGPDPPISSGTNVPVLVEPVNFRVTTAVVVRRVFVIRHISHGRRLRGFQTRS